MIFKHALSHELPATLASDGDWMLVLPAGEMTTRDERPDFHVGDIANMKAIVARSLKRAGMTELMVDYDHQGYEVSNSGGGTAIAAGWIKKLEVREDGIWAFIQWTDKARGHIKAGEYRYLSPMFTSNDNNKVEVILNIALVNMPALDLYAEAAAAELNSNPENTNMKFLEKLKKALKLGDDVSEADILTAIGDLGKAGTQTVVVATAVSDALKPIALAAGLDEDARPETMITTIKKMVEGDGGTSVITALQAELSDTTNKLNTLQSGVAKDKAEAFVDGAIKLGRTGVKPMRDHYIKRHMSDALNVEMEINAFPILGDSGTTIIPPAPGDGSVALSADQTQAATLLGIDAKDYAKTLAGERASA